MNKNKFLYAVRHLLNNTKPWYKRISIYVASLLILFIIVGILTTVTPTYRISSSTISKWTSQITGASFLYVLSMENKAFTLAYPSDSESIVISDLMFEMATSIKPNDPRSLLGRELPGFEAYDSKIIIAGEGTNYTNLPIESAAPLDVILEEREATVTEEEEIDVPDKQPSEDQPTTGERDVVFIYNSHNRESFMPHLPDVTDTDLAHHPEVNIGKVSQRLAKGLEALGIGTQVDDTDIMEILNQKGWKHWQSYAASKPIVQEALATNKDIQYLFDIHRDAIAREHTTTTIDGQEYAKLAFVIGEDYANDENLKLANELHKRIEQIDPSLTRGVIMQGGSGNNGVYNQDLSNNSVLIEFGGVHNTLEELYRTADILAEVFSEFYWDAEKVQGKS